MSMDYYAHSENKQGRKQTQKEHLEGVAARAVEYVRPAAWAAEMQYAALLHDLGKYSELFQRRLKGLEHGLDHWTPGAWAAFAFGGSVMSALAIQGHHIGLQKGDAKSIEWLDPSKPRRELSGRLALTETDIQALFARLKGDGLCPEPPANPAYTKSVGAVGPMLDARMFFSALVDADFLDTEAHFQEARAKGVALESIAAFELVRAKVAKLADGGKGTAVVQGMRADLWEACVRGADAGPGLFTLSAPTGSGKTLAMLGFALEHARRNHLRRVIMVVPYLSIIEQTAAIWHELFDEAFGPEFVLEHHSMSGTRAEPEVGTQDYDAQVAALRRQRELAENWDAPLIITTNVQLLESLFSNRPGACRKLHRIAESVVLFDEVQTLPVELVVPTLGALSHLSQRFGTSVVFATATQPAFNRLDAAVKKAGSPGWAPSEIVPASAGLFGRQRRVQVRWPEDGVTMGWDDVAKELIQRDQSLCIVNVKKHAAELARAIQKERPEGLLHLSTLMCPAHRKAVMREVNARMVPDGKEVCRLIATQCVEAGVDLDAAFGMRAMGPLESIAQAAGRVNRNGLRHLSDLIVFRTEDEACPPGVYARATRITQSLLSDRGADGMDIDDPALFQSYYRKLYGVAPPEELAKELQQAILIGDFADVAKRYQLIPSDSINILVPYAPMIDTFEELAAEARANGLSARWMRRAHPLTISIFRPRANDPVIGYLERVKVAGKTDSEDWFIYTYEPHYDALLGLTAPTGSEVLSA